MFKIDNEYIKPEHRTSSVINSLYAAVYDEFRGASRNEKYKDLTYEQRMAKLNQFAEKWLRDKGLYK
jgi:hypothetical protein